MYDRRDRRRSQRLITLMLAVLLVTVTVALVVSRRQLARAISGETANEQAEAPAASPAEGGAAAPGGAPAGSASSPASSSPGSSASASATFAAAGEADPPPASEGFLRVGQPGVDYTSAYVVDRASGRVLYAYNAHQPVPTASMAKMMTSLIVMEEIDAGRLSLDDVVTTSARASTMGGSQIYAREGQTFTVETLLAATMVQSANDAATALAEKVAGNVEAFATLMNRRAAELGLEASTFYDPHGLPSADGNENVMTARDLAVLGHELMRYPLMREYAETATLPFENATFTSGMTNPNLMLRSYEGAYGIKTGYTGSAGFSITAAARRGDTDVLAVVTGAKSSRGPTSSFELAGRFMDEVFLGWSTVVAVKEGDPVGEVPVAGGAERTVAAVAAHDVSALVPRGGEDGVRWTLEPGEVEAPIPEGEPVGTIVVLEGDREIGRVPALAAQAVDERPWWRFWGE